MMFVTYILESFLFTVFRSQDVARYGQGTAEARDKRVAL